MYSTTLRQLGFRPRPYRSSRLREYYIRMSKDREEVLFDDNVAAMLKAQGFQFQETPRSIYRVEKLYEALQGYAPKKMPLPSADDLSAGIKLAYSCFAKPKSVKPLEIMEVSAKTVVEVTSNPSGSAGLTNYGHTKAESQTRALERGIQTIKGVKAPEPCLAFSRTQFNDKTRLVWGYPYSMTFIEGMFAKPLIEEFKKRSSPMAFGQSNLTLGTKLRVSTYHKEWAYSLDMSKFDSTISRPLIHKAFRIIATWFQLDEIEPVTGKKYSDILDIIEGYFIFTPIVMPDGNVYFGKDHGVPSGSYFTQMVDSIVNVIILGSIAHHFVLKLAKEDIYVLGDDILFFANRKVSLDAIADYANSRFGVKVHGSEKSEIYHFDEPIHFLGRYWTNGLPSVPEDEILARMVYPERFRKRSKDPEEAKREVKLLILSYAAVYRNAWRIAEGALGFNDVHSHHGVLPVEMDVLGMSPESINPDHLSGLARYKQKYAESPGQGRRDIVLQYLS